MSDTVYRAGSNLLASELNDFQDDYDATIYRSWKTFGSALFELTDANAAATRYVRPGIQGAVSTTVSAAVAFYMFWLGHWPAGETFRAGQIRLVLDIVGNDLCPSNLVSLVQLKEVNSFATPSFFAPDIEIVAPALVPGRNVIYSGNAMYPFDGLYTISLAHGTMPANGYAIFQIILQHRQYG